MTNKIGSLDTVIEFNLLPVPENQDLLWKLDSAGATGLDMSPGNTLCQEAAERIRELEQQVASLKQTLNEANAEASV